MVSQNKTFSFRIIRQVNNSFSNKWRHVDCMTRTERHRPVQNLNTKLELSAQADQGWPPMFVCVCAGGGGGGGGRRRLP